jgi:hypothetical protein
MDHANFEVTDTYVSTTLTKIKTTSSYVMCSHNVPRAAVEVEEDELADTGLSSLAR